MSLETGARLAVSVALGVLLSPSVSQAYPWFIRHEYTSCTSCHFAPRGGGMLTDYGQGIAGSMSLFPVDYQGPPTSRLYKDFTLNGAVTHGGEFRVMNIEKRGAKSATFPMQADYLDSLRFSERFRMDNTVGIHVQRNTNGTVNLNGSYFDRIVLRKSLLAYRYNDHSELEVGRDWLDIGLNIDDHTVFVRSQNRRGVVDYPTQVRWDTWSDSVRHTPFAFGPSFEENDMNREWGFGYRVEKYLNSRMAVGATALFGRSPAISRELLDVFTRLSLTEKLVLLAEYDWTNRQLVSLGGNPSFQQHAVYLRPTYEALEWLEVGVVGEYYSRMSPFDDRDLKYGPSVYARIVRQLTLILDLRDSLSPGLQQQYLALQLFGHL